MLIVRRGSIGIKGGERVFRVRMKLGMRIASAAFLVGCPGDLLRVWARRRGWGAWSRELLAFPFTVGLVVLRYLAGLAFPVPALGSLLIADARLAAVRRFKGHSAGPTALRGGKDFTTNG